MLKHPMPTDMAALITEIEINLPSVCEMNSHREGDGERETSP